MVYAQTTINPQQQKGFTLVELLIVIAIIGVLAGVLLVALNPFEQFARARDAGRISAVTQIGRAISNYYTSHAGTTFPAGATWYTELTTNSSDLNTLSVPLVAGSGTNCTRNAQSANNNVCYGIISSGADAAVWTAAESQNEINKYTAGNGGTACANIVDIVYVFSKGQVFLDCLAKGASPTVTGSTPDLLVTP